MLYSPWFLLLTICTSSLHCALIKDNINYSSAIKLPAIGEFDHLRSLRIRRRNESSFIAFPQYATDGFEENAERTTWSIDVPPGAPRPQCFTNEYGFMCCNRKLQALMEQTYQFLSTKPYWNTCNIQLVCNIMQKSLEDRFLVSFEMIAGLSDFAAKAHFYGNYLCKIKQGDRYLLAYAAPRNETPLIPYQPTPKIPSVQIRKLIKPLAHKHNCPHSFWQRRQLFRHSRTC
ncbi:hypothetical protein AB6A40_002306 [Gnathostoma spinigerum]|uniref:Ground-like domain-containing protein n=1 Tax=Gnathostoma spinigerum TaxID=75299 RepID=A0ABD6E8H2_9BILA